MSFQKAFAEMAWLATLAVLDAVVLPVLFREAPHTRVDFLYYHFYLDPYAGIFQCLCLDCQLFSSKLLRRSGH